MVDALHGERELRGANLLARAAATGADVAALDGLERRAALARDEPGQQVAGRLVTVALRAPEEPPLVVA